MHVNTWPFANTGSPASSYFTVFTMQIMCCCCCCCSPLVVSVVRGEVGRGYCRLFFVFSSLSPLLSHCVLYQQSPTPIFFLMFSPPTLSKSLLTQTSHHTLGLPCLLCPSTSWAPVLFTNFSSPILFHMSGPYQPTPHQFLLKSFLHSNIHS